MGAGVKIAVIIALVVMIVSLIAGTAIVVLTDGRIHEDRFFAEQTIDDKKSFAGEGIDEIAIAGISTDVSMIPGQSDEIEVRFSGKTNKPDSPKLLTRVVDDKLVIEIKHPVTFFSLGGFDDTKLDILVPYDYSGKIKIETVSGRIGMERMDLKRLSASSVSGNILIDQVSSASTDVGTVSGDITFQGYLGQVSSSTTSGNTRIGLSALSEDLEIGSISGNVYLTLPSDSGFNLDYSTVSGKVENAFPINVKSSGREGIRGTVGDGRYDIEVHTVSGDLSIDKGE